jgi:hypothetical protein
MNDKVCKIKLSYMSRCHSFDSLLNRHNIVSKHCTEHLGAPNCVEWGNTVDLRSLALAFLNVGQFTLMYAGLMIQNWSWG